MYIKQVFFTATSDTHSSSVESDTEVVVRPHLPARDATTV